MNTARLAAVVALLVSGTAPGADTSTIAYELALGGNNHVADWEQGFPPPPLVAFSPGSPDDYPAATAEYTTGDIITWDVRVMASGQKDDASAYFISGATNLEFSLEIRRDTIDGQLEAEAIFFSTMNDGDADPAGGGPSDPLEMAAFCHIFNVPCPMRGLMGLTCPGDGHGPAGDGTGPGRAYDPLGSGGPEMDRVQFPSTSTHAGGRITGAEPAGHKPAGGTGVVADPPSLAGKLVGMGVGYSRFSFPGGNTAGVGIDPALGVGGIPGYGGVCYRGLGQLPIFEGQIDTSYMTCDTYCLKLVPGANNNVMPGNIDCEHEDPGEFAVPANQVIGDTIVFMVCGCPLPVIESWATVRYHGGAVGADLPITLDPAATGDDVVSETRLGGIQKIVVDFDGDATLCYTPGQVVVEDANTHADFSGLITSEELVIHVDNRSTLVIEFAGGLPDETCYRIDLAEAIPCLSGDTDCMVRGLVGDVNLDPYTNLIDMAFVKSKNGSDPSVDDHARFDVNVDGSINLIDMALVKSLNGNECDCPPSGRERGKNQGDVYAVRGAVSRRLRRRSDSTGNPRVPGERTEEGRFQRERNGGLGCESFVVWLGSVADACDIGIGCRHGSSYHDRRRFEYVRAGPR